MPTKHPISPRVAALENGVGTFWHEIEEEGAPLVEPIEAEPGWSLLTFLWRDRDGDTRNVFIVGGPGHWSIREDVMRHVQGSDVWFRTYRVRSDFRGPYRLSPNDSLVDLDDVEDEDWPARSAGFQPDPLNPRRLVWPRDSWIGMADSPPPPGYPADPSEAQDWLKQRWSKHLDRKAGGDAQKEAS
jgi:hypothetical protein